MKKRTFIKNLGVLGLLPFSNGFLKDAPKLSLSLQNTTNLNDNEFWELVRSQYKLNPNFINLESGYYNIIPTPTL